MVACRDPCQVTAMITTTQTNNMVHNTVIKDAHRWQLSLFAESCKQCWKTVLVVRTCLTEQLPPCHTPAAAVMRRQMDNQ